MDSTFPDFNLKNKVALVTGAARGIGRACALALANAGADIVLGLRDVNTGDDVQDTIENMGRRVVRLQMDISKTNEINAAIDSVVSEFGRLDILVNNVGVGPENAAENVTESDFDYTINVNVKGTFFTSQAAAKVMIKQKSGTIINISSQAGVVALADESIYCLSKAAVNHMTKCLALEWAKHKVTVNAVAPTFINTPGTEKWLSDEPFRKSVVDRIPLGKIGNPMDVAGTVVFLASSAAAMITGEIILIDGGWTIQ